jgi:hypothetical protein
MSARVLYENGGTEKKLDFCSRQAIPSSARFNDPTTWSDSRCRAGGVFCTSKVVVWGKVRSPAVLEPVLDLAHPTSRSSALVMPQQAAQPFRTLDRPLPDALRRQRPRAAWRSVVLGLMWALLILMPGIFTHQMA